MVNPIPPINSAPNSKPLPPLPQVSQEFQSTISACQTTPTDLVRIICQQGCALTHPSSQTEDPKAQTDAELKLFVKKASMLTTVKNMDPTIDDSTAMKIVKDAKNQNLFEAFIKERGQTLSWPSRIYARWNYFLYYKLGLISVTLETFTANFLKMTRENFTTEAGTRRAAVVDKLLSELSSFLDICYQAITDYANNKKITGNLKVHIATALDQQQKTPLKQLCEQFSEMAIRNFIPKIEFFESLQTSPNVFLKLLGNFLNFTVGWFFNRFILQPALRREIPIAVQSLIESGIKTAQSTNLPFAVSITKGMLTQLSEFNTQFDKEQTQMSSEPPIVNAIMGINELPNVVKKLIDILELCSYETIPELRAHLHQSRETIVSQTISLKDQLIRQKIENGMNDACRTLLAHFLSPANNHEGIFYQFFNLLNETFESHPTSKQDWENLIKDYSELKNQLAAETNEVFQKAIQQAVRESIRGLPQHKIRQYQEHFEREQIDRAPQTSKSLFTSFQEIDQKIKDLLAAPDDQHSLVVDLDKMVKIIKDYLDNVRATEQAINGLKTSVPRDLILQANRDAIAPICQEMKSFLAQIDKTKYHQNRLIFYSLLAQKLPQIKDNQILSIDEFSDSLSQISKTYAHDSDFADSIKPALQKYQIWQKEHQKFEALTRLVFLIRNIGTAIVAQSGWNEMKQIVSSLPDLSIEDKNLLLTYQTPPESGDLGRKWQPLLGKVQAQLQQHEQKQQSLNQEITQWAEKSLQECTTVTQDAKMKLSSCKDSLFTSIKTLQTLSEHLSFSYDPARHQGFVRKIFSSMKENVMSSVKDRVFIPAADSLGETFVTPKLKEILTNLNKFLNEQHLWKWVATDSIKCLNEAFHQ